MFSQDFGAKMSISYRSQTAVPRFGTNNTQGLGNKRQKKNIFDRKKLIFSYHLQYIFGGKPAQKKLLGGF